MRIYESKHIAGPTVRGSFADASHQTRLNIGTRLLTVRNAKNGSPGKRSLECPYRVVQSECQCMVGLWSNGIMLSGAVGPDGVGMTVPAPDQDLSLA